MIATSGNSAKFDRRLFRQEIRAAVAHCNGLFRAGVLTRQEAERLKNGLWTVLKRADFDPNFGAALPQLDVFAFVQTRLFQLVNSAADNFRIGRSRPHQRAVVLRLWLREELALLGEQLEQIIEILGTKPADSFFARFAESFDRDRERFGEISRRTNRMPVPQFPFADDSLREFDADGVAHELEFAGVLENSLDAASDRDFCVEFAAAAALAMLHAANLANEILRAEPTMIDDHKRESLEAARGKAAAAFGYPSVLLALLKNLPADGAAADFDEVCPVVFAAADTLKANLQTVAAFLDS